jgi:hypothetical protein
MITQLPTEVAVPQYDTIPYGEVWLLNGLPKTGKTTFCASFPDNCVIEVERSGAKWVENAYVVEPQNTKDVDQIIKLLRADRGRFKAVTLDTVDSLSLWIEKDICNSYKVSCISNAGGGYGIGRNELNTRLISIVDDLVSLNKTLIIITHCRDDKGAKSLLLTETLLTYMQGKASIIGYCYKELEGNKINYLIDWSGRGTVVAGSRHPLFARSGVMGNSYSEIEKLFAPKPAKWEQMLKWYEKRDIVLKEGYTKFIKEKFGEEAELETLLPDEVKTLIVIGAGHTKNDSEMKAFQKKYGTKPKS